MLTGEEIKKKYFSKYGDPGIYNMRDSMLKAMWYGGPVKETNNSRKLRIRTTSALNESRIKRKIILKQRKMYESKIARFQEYKGVYFMKMYKTDIELLYNNVPYDIMVQTFNDRELIEKIQENNPTTEKGRKNKNIPLNPTNININYPQIINNSDKSSERITHLRNYAKQISDEVNKLLNNILLKNKNGSRGANNKINASKDFKRFAALIKSNKLSLLNKLYDENLKYMDIYTYRKYNIYLTILYNIIRFDTTRNL
jgi:hypothetical protein